MRPVRIELEGFTAFRHRTVVSFEDTELFALVGATGAGKSSLIDAMVFALYGKVPRYQDDRAVAPVINAQSAEAKVRLDFEVGGQVYSAVRVVRRTKAGASTKEARLEHNAQVIAGDARSLDDAVGELLGLTFEQFTKTVVLPQGDFARFLHERPAERQELLVRLLDLGVYGHMASMARDRARAHGERIAILEDEIGRLGTADRDAAAHHRKRAADLVSLADEIRDTLADIDRAEQDLAAIRAEGEILRSQQKALLEIATPAAVVEQQARFRDARAADETARRSLARAREDADGALHALAEIPDEAHLREVLRGWDRRSERESALAAAVVRHGDLELACAEALDALTRAERRAKDADAVLQRAQDRARAAALRHELHIGAPCPVCEHVVERLPAPVPVRELDDARAEQHHASSARDAAAAAYEKARRANERTADDLVRLREEIESLVRILDGAPSRAECEAALALAGECRAREAATRKALLAAERGRRATEAALAEIDELGRTLRRDFTTARDALASLSPPLPGEVDLLEDWSHLVAWSSSVAGQVGKSIQSLLDKHAEVAGSRDALRESVHRSCAAFAVDAAQPRLLEFIAQLAERAEADARAADELIARLEAINSDVEQARQHLHVADDLARLLGANGFQQWLLEEALDDLIDDASARLFTLSSGQFTLERDGKQFAVRDHRNALDLRSVKTLSGGETFLASLALALALAENVSAVSAAGSPRLESIFLDEGFGSLDPETLDVVASAIEELGASGRMVGVVTHIRELADRLPVRYEVRKLPESSVVERVEG